MQVTCMACSYYHYWKTLAPTVLTLAVEFGMLWPSAAWGAIKYTVTDLGVLAATASEVFTSSEAYGVSSNGQVVGQSYNAGGGQPHAFYYDGTMHDLAPLAFESEAWGINASGQVALSIYGSYSGWNGYVYDGTLHPLGTLGKSGSDAYSINSSGEVTGDANTTDGYHAVIYDGTIHDLGSLGGCCSSGLSINDNGWVAGSSNLASPNNKVNHAFIYDGTMHDLGTLGGTFSTAWGINNSGQVAGWSKTAMDATHHAFLYDGTLHDLGTLGGAGSHAWGINDDGKVVGDSELSSGVCCHGFLYTPADGMVDLNTLIDPSSGWELGDARAINNSGQIAGSGLIHGQYHAALLSPLVAGDYNHNGVVDAADYTVWRDSFGRSGAGLAADGDGDGTIGSGDLNVWKANCGQTFHPGGAGSSFAIPEPSAVTLLMTAVIAIMPMGSCRRRAI
jgi:probable HAF family extracellular repeat protein